MVSFEINIHELFSVYCLSHIFGNALSSCELPVSLACELCFLKYHFCLPLTYLPTVPSLSIIVIL